MKVSFSDKIGSTPAIVRRDTGDIYLNPRVWFSLPMAYRRFIFYHEVGHYLLQTTSELEADTFAFQQIAGTEPESLKKTVRTLYRVLPFNTPLQFARIENMYRLALTYDQYYKPDQERLNEIRRVEKSLKNNYPFNQQVLTYMTSTKGKITDYEFPGYDPGQFKPAIGSWFKDIPISKPTVNDEVNETWSGSNMNYATSFMDQYRTPIIAVAPAPEKKVEEVDLSVLPEFTLPKTIDLKSVVIGLLIFLAIYGFSKL